MGIESSREVKISADKHREEADWVKIQIRDALSSLKKDIVVDKAETFYEKKENEIVYNMDTVRDYLTTLKEKKSWKELTSSNSSAMVMAVQISLYSLGYEFWNIDWLLGDRTKQAIKKFQKDNELPIDPYWRVLPTTIEKLLESISEKEEVAVSNNDKNEYVVVEEWKWDEEKPGEGESEEGDVKDEGELNPEWGEAGVFIKLDENMEWINAQETIRPEIQELIDSYNWNAEHFKNVTELTKAEAKAINELHWAAWQYLYFSSLEKIHPAALEELMNHHSGMQLWLKTLSKEQAEKMEGFKYGIEFNNLTTLDPSVAQSLAKAWGKLEFSAVWQVSPEIMEAFSGRESGDLIFETVDMLDAQTAEKMVHIQYPWTIYFNGIKEISWEVAQVLAQKPERFGLKNLDSTKTLSNEVLDALSKFPYLHLNQGVVDQVAIYKKAKKIEGKQLTAPILELYNSDFRNMDGLKNITSLSYDDAVLLSESWKSLDLSWIEEFAPDVFEVLMETKAPITLGLEEFPESLAEKVPGRTYGLTFKNLKTLEPNIANYLYNCHWELKLDALENITPETAKILARKKESLISLNWIKEENPQVFEAFNNYSGNVIFSGISEITEESAKVLERKQNGLIYLHGLKDPLPDELVPHLANNITHISTDPESRIPRQLDRYLHPEKYEE